MKHHFDLSRDVAEGPVQPYMPQPDLRGAGRHLPAPLLLHPLRALYQRDALRQGEAPPRGKKRQYQISVKGFHACAISALLFLYSKTFFVIFISN